MTMDERKHAELLEVYKLHARSADLVSLRRDRMHHLFVAVFTVVGVVFGAVVRFSESEPLPPAALDLIAIAGIALSLVWFALVRSYQQLNSGKFAALHRLEEEMAFPFYKIEWEILKEGKDFKVYWKLTVVERLLPLVFLLLSIAVLVMY